jgi:hypothetical protein
MFRPAVRTLTRTVLHLKASRRHPCRCCPKLPSLLKSEPAVPPPCRHTLGELSFNQNCNRQTRRGFVRNTDKIALSPSVRSNESALESQHPYRASQVVPAPDSPDPDPPIDQGAPAAEKRVQARRCIASQNDNHRPPAHNSAYLSGDPHVPFPCQRLVPLSHSTFVHASRSNLESPNLATKHSSRSSSSSSSSSNRLLSARWHSITRPPPRSRNHDVRGTAINTPAACLATPAAATPTTSTPTTSSERPQHAQHPGCFPDTVRRLPAQQARFEVMVERLQAALETS